MSEPAALLVPPTSRAIPVRCIDADVWDRQSRSLPARHRKWLAACGFAAKPGQHGVIQSGEGLPETVYWSGGEAGDAFAFGRLARLLPAGTYRMENFTGDLGLAALGWLLEAYQFDRYKARLIPVAKLATPAQV